MSVDFQRIIQHCVSEDKILHNHRWKNPKSFIPRILYIFVTFICLFSPRTCAISEFPKLNWLSSYCDAVLHSDGATWIYAYLVSSAFTSRTYATYAETISSSTLCRIKGRFIVKKADVTTKDGLRVAIRWKISSCRRGDMKYFALSHGIFVSWWLFHSSRHFFSSFVI
jgi:hypothetical protein